MSAISVTSVQVLDNPQFFANPLQFEIQYECLHDLQHGARESGRGDRCAMTGHSWKFEIRRRAREARGRGTTGARDDGDARCEGED
jgi:hypothetical protein